MKKNKENPRTSSRSSQNEFIVLFIPVRMNNYFAAQVSAICLNPDSTGSMCIILDMYIMLLCYNLKRFLRASVMVQPAVPTFHLGVS